MTFQNDARVFKTPESDQPPAHDTRPGMDTAVEAAMRGLIRAEFHEMGIDDVSDEAIDKGLDEGLANGEDWRAMARAALAAAVPVLRESWEAPIRKLHEIEARPTSEHYDCDPHECDRAGEGDHQAWCLECRRWAPCDTLQTLDDLTSGPTS